MASSWMPERFVAPNILVATSTHDSISKKRQRRRRRAFAKVGLRKDPVARFNIDPPSILVPAPLPKELEDALVPKVYAFSGLQTYGMRKRALRGRERVAQELYSPTRVTFASMPSTRAVAESAAPEHAEMEDELPAHASTAASGLYENSSVLTVVSDTPSHGMGIASRALKQVAKGSHTSFGLSNRFQAESMNQKRQRVDRMYDIDTGPKCGVAKSVTSSLFGNALAHSTSQRFPDTGASLVESPGPGSYKTSFNLISTRISDRWDMQSSAFRSNTRSNFDRKRLGRLGQGLMANTSSSPSLQPTVMKSSLSKIRRTRPHIQKVQEAGQRRTQTKTAKHRGIEEDPLVFLNKGPQTKSGWVNDDNVVVVI